MQLLFVFLMILRPSYLTAVKGEATTELRRVENESRDSYGQEQVELQEVQVDEVVGAVVLGRCAQDYVWLPQRRWCCQGVTDIQDLRDST